MCIHIYIYLYSIIQVNFRKVDIGFVVFLRFPLTDFTRVLRGYFFES